MTLISPYSHPDLTSDCTDTDSQPQELSYDRSVRSRFIVSLWIVGLMFLWGILFISDGGWTSLGLAVLVMLIAFYKFRIARTVTLGGETVRETAFMRCWEWRWEEIYRIVRKITSESAGKPYSGHRLERLILIHESGREIALDTHMEGYTEARDLIMRKSRELKLEISVQVIPFFILVYW